MQIARLPRRNKLPPTTSTPQAWQRPGSLPRARTRELSLCASPALMKQVNVGWGETGLAKGDGEGGTGWPALEGEGAQFLAAPSYSNI